MTNSERYCGTHALSASSSPNFLCLQEILPLACCPCVLDTIILPVNLLRPSSLPGMNSAVFLSVEIFHNTLKIILRVFSEAFGSTDIVTTLYNILVLLVVR